MAEFPRRNWSLAAVKRLLQKIDATGSADRKTGSGRRRTARTDGNVNVVKELALSQENAVTFHFPAKAKFAPTCVRNSLLSELS